MTPDNNIRDLSRREFLKLTGRTLVAGAMALTGLERLGEWAFANSPTPYGRVPTEDYKDFLRREFRDTEITQGPFRVWLAEFSGVVVQPLSQPSIEIAVGDTTRTVLNLWHTSFRRLADEKTRGAIHSMAASGLKRLDSGLLQVEILRAESLTLENGEPNPNAGRRQLWTSTDAVEWEFKGLK